MAAAAFAETFNAAKFRKLIPHTILQVLYSGIRGGGAVDREVEDFIQVTQRCKVGKWRQVRWTRINSDMSDKKCIQNSGEEAPCEVATRATEMEMRGYY
jgi:hypothetical protein